ncbi:MAG: YopX family protein [Promethearchaeota archaeon]
MKRLKFRAWSPSTKKMYLPEKGCDLLIRIDGKLFVDIDIKENIGIAPINTDDLIIMQYIGLQDVNNKDIYEGDILRVCYKCEDEIEMFLNPRRRWISGKRIYEQPLIVHWLEDDDSFPGFEVRYPDGEWFEPLVYFNESKVIGNIYEGIKNHRKVAIRKKKTNTR